MIDSICGIDCEKCGLKKDCGRCAATKGKPFGGDCLIARCCIDKGLGRCGKCPDKSCGLKEKLIAEFNALGIEDMEKITDLNAIKGSFINIEYPFPNGQAVKMWDDKKIYLGNQTEKKNSGRYYGLAADGNYLMVSEYGKDGADAEIVIFKRRN